MTNFSVWNRNRSRPFLRGARAGAPSQFGQSRSRLLVLGLSEPSGAAQKSGGFATLEKITISNCIHELGEKLCTGFVEPSWKVIFMLSFKLFRQNFFFLSTNSTFCLTTVVYLTTLKDQIFDKIFFLLGVPSILQY